MYIYTQQRFVYYFTLTNSGPICIFHKSKTDWTISCTAFEDSRVPVASSPSLERERERESK